MPLYCAAWQNQKATLLLLLKMGANMEWALTEDCHLRLLHMAVAEGHVLAGIALIVAGADIEASSRHGYRPFHIASGNGHAAFVGMLLAEGAAIEGDTLWSRLHGRCFRFAYGCLK